MFSIKRLLLALMTMYFAGYVLSRLAGLLYLDKWGFYGVYSVRIYNVIAPANFDIHPITIVLWYFYIPVHYSETVVRNAFDDRGST